MSAGNVRGLPLGEVRALLHIHIYLQGRGSNNPNTGPQRDHASFATNRVTGAFAYIDAGHPRRPGDKVRSFRYIGLYCTVLYCTVLY